MIVLIVGVSDVFTLPQNILPKSNQASRRRGHSIYFAKHWFGNLSYLSNYHYWILFFVYFQVVIRIFGLAAAAGIMITFSGHFLTLALFTYIPQPNSRIWTLATHSLQNNSKALSLYLRKVEPLLLALLVSGRMLLGDIYNKSTDLDIATGLPEEKS